MDARTERFRRLFEPVHDRVLTFARGLCKSPADGDDLFQESALRAYSPLPVDEDSDRRAGWRRVSARAGR